MQTTYSLNVEYDSENIKSLSEDDDAEYDDDYKAYDPRSPYQETYTPPTKESVNRYSDNQNDPYIIHIYPMNTQPLKIPQSDTESVEDIANDNDAMEEEEEDEDMDEILVLDKDIEIAKILNCKGYKRLKKLCSTDQGSVWRAKSPKQYGSSSVVIKIASKLHYNLDKKCVISSEHENILKEIELLQHLNMTAANTKHSNDIIKVMDTIENEENYMVVLEDGGMDLFNFCSQVHEQIKRNRVSVGEWQKTLKLICKRMIELIHWLHSIKICHLDISLENILISNIQWITYPDQYKNWKKKLSPDFTLKFIDFGAAQSFEEECFDCKSLIGKPQYCSPQIYGLQNKRMNEAFDARKADVWSYGVCIFIMAFGTYPWKHSDEKDELYQMIVIDQNLEFLLTQWNRSTYLDENMKDLLQKIFVIDEDKRISTEQIVKNMS